MNTKFEFGYVELLLVCGVWLCTQELMIMGCTLCILSVISSITKFGLSIQKEQQEEINYHLAVDSLENSGEEFAKSINPARGKSKKTVN